MNSLSHLKPRNIVFGDGRQIQRLAFDQRLHHVARLHEHAADDRTHLELFAAARTAGAAGLSVGRVGVGDPRSRWGSCTHDGRLMFSWRLILAPPPVLDYVAAHEVAHLAQMNHSPAFWAEVARLMPDYEPHRRWLKAEGGLPAMAERNRAKAALLYDTIDESPLYENKVARNCRSRMNVPFFLRDETLNDAFLAGAKAAGLLQLKGHKSVGGMRASLYNAMPLEGVQALVDYMREFEKEMA